MKDRDAQVRRDGTSCTHTMMLPTTWMRQSAAQSTVCTSAPPMCCSSCILTCAKYSCNNRWLEEAPKLGCQGSLRAADVDDASTLAHQGQKGFTDCLGAQEVCGEGPLGLLSIEAIGSNAFAGSQQRQQQQQKQIPGSGSKSKFHAVEHAALLQRSRASSALSAGRPSLEK